MTESNKKNIILEQVPYIYYLFHFLKNIIDIRALIDFGSKVNVKTSAYAASLGLKIRLIDIEAQKIDNFNF